MLFAGIWNCGAQRNAIDLALEALNLNRQTHAVSGYAMVDDYPVSHPHESKKVEASGLWRAEISVWWII